MRTVVVTSELEASAEVVWPALTTPHAFVHVAAPILRYPVAERIDRPWHVGDEVEGWLFLMGVLPVARHRIRVESIDEASGVIVSEEGGGLIRRWRHRLTLEPVDAHRCRYEDRVEIDAGPLTRLVAAFATAFYRHRHRRWARLARLLAAAAG